MSCLDLSATVVQTRGPISRPFANAWDRQAVELILRWRSGDADALDELVVVHDRFIWWIVNRMAEHLGIEREHDKEDMAQAGRYGLVVSARYYDPNIRPFLSYATRNVRTEIRRSLKYLPLIRVPLRYLVEGTPTAEDDDAEAARRAIRLRARGRDRPDDPVDHDALPWVAAPPDPEPGREEVSGSTVRLLERLTDCERQVLSRRFGLADGQERTQGEIAADLGVSHQAISRSEVRGIRRAREILELATC